MLGDLCHVWTALIAWLHLVKLVVVRARLADQPRGIHTGVQLGSISRWLRQWKSEGTLSQYLRDMAECHVVVEEGRRSQSPARHVWAIWCNSLHQKKAGATDPNVTITA